MSVTDMEGVAYQSSHLNLDKKINKCIVTKCQVQVKSQSNTKTYLSLAQ